MHQCLLLSALLLLLSCHAEQDDTSAPLQAGAPVEVTHPLHKDLTEYLDLNATTLFMKKETLRATFPGFIDTLAKAVGDPVRAGDLLLRLKTREAAAGDSLAPGTLPLPTAVSICARTNGILVALQFNTGDFVTEGEEIARIANPSSLRISLNVPYEYAVRIDRRIPCEILLPDGQKMTAVIHRVLPNVDPATQTQTFLLQLQRAVSLPENLNLSARLPLRTAVGATIVPRGAIQCDETMRRFWIMKLTEANTAVRVDIAKGIESGDEVQVVAPQLLPTDLIISAGAYGLPDTARVALSGSPHE